MNYFVLLKNVSEEELDQILTKVHMLIHISERILRESVFRLLIKNLHFNIPFCCDSCGFRKEQSNYETGKFNRQRWGEKSYISYMNYVNKKVNKAKNNKML